MKINDWLKMWIIFMFDRWSWNITKTFWQKIDFFYRLKMFFFYYYWDSFSIFILTDFLWIKGRRFSAPLGSCPPSSWRHDHWRHFPDLRLKCVKKLPMRMKSVGMRSGSRRGGREEKPANIKGTKQRNNLTFIPFKWKYFEVFRDQ